MEAIRSQFNKPWVIGLAGVILGIVLGLIWGYLISPVEWYDAAIYHLRQDLQEEYLRMAIDSNTLRPDPQIANKRFKELGEFGPAVLQQIQSQPGAQDLDAINQFNRDASAGVTAVLPEAEPTSVVQEPGEPAATEQTPAEGAPLPPAVDETQPVTEIPEEDSGRSPLLTLLYVMCGITLVLGGALAVIFLIRSRRASPEGVLTPAQQAIEAARQAQYTDYESGGEEPPMAQFMASYKLGDDLFDDSFSVDSPTGEFMGECGVGISETIGVGDPKKVTAFEVWLFDKNDIQTVTKVLMSAHAFRDEAIRQRLAAKGEPVLAEPAGQALLQTATLRLVAKIVDMNYGEGALPDRSFFDNLILEIAVWQK